MATASPSSACSLLGGLPPPPGPGAAGGDAPLALLGGELLAYGAGSCVVVVDVSEKRRVVDAAGGGCGVRPMPFARLVPPTDPAFPLQLRTMQVATTLVGPHAGAAVTAVAWHPASAERGDPGPR